MSNSVQWPATLPHLSISSTGPLYLHLLPTSPLTKGHWPLFFSKPHWTPQCSYNVTGMALPRGRPLNLLFPLIKRSSCQISKQIVLFLSVEPSLEVLCKTAKCFNNSIFLPFEHITIDRAGWDGGKIKREGIYVCTQLIHLIVHGNEYNMIKVLTVQCLKKDPIRTHPIEA